MRRLHAAFMLDNPWTVAAGFDSAERSPARITLAEAKALLANPAAAELQARKILGKNAADPVALYLLGAALLRQERHEAATAVLEPLSRSQPQMHAAWRELGFALKKLREQESATAALLKAFDLDRLDADVLFALGDLLPFEDVPATSSANATEPRRPDAPPDVAASQFRHAAQLFARRDFGDALPHIDGMLQQNRNSILLRSLRAIALAGKGQPAAAVAEFELFIETCTENPGLWLEYARALRENRDGRAPAAIKRAIAILPSFVEAYVLYASIKPFPWDEALIAQVRAQLARGDLVPEDRAQLNFALGKALEDLGLYGESFENYRTCNEILRREGDEPAKASANFTRRTAAVFRPMLFRTRRGSGFPARDPIFIVGMKRSGSTLVEQILSRHPQIEALGELEDLTTVLGRVRGYPNSVKDLDPAALHALGKDYMALTAPRRKLGKPFFTDKLPHNFGRVGLIHLILPNAKIVDVRRHPLDCGLSCYKHFFPGARISLSQTDFASGYVDYVRLMAHFDRVLPGKVHRVIYEHLVANLEQEVRRLLGYLGLPFAPECLSFHEQTRRVDTPSADQVRTPLYGSAVEYWRNYERWLGPMKEKLGPVLEVYPDVPKFYEEIHVRMRRPLSLGQAGGQFATVRGLRQRRVEMV